jgi:hypothetical protein
MAEAGEAGEATEGEVAKPEREYDINIEPVREREAIFEQIYEDYPLRLARIVAKKEIDEQGHFETAFRYAETSYEEVGIMLRKIKEKHGGLKKDEVQKQIFYDLGSGFGRPVFAAAILFPFAKVIGIELLEGLFVMSNEIIKQWEPDIKPQLPSTHQATEVKFVKGCCSEHWKDDLNWADGSIVFCHSTQFDERLMTELTEHAMKMQTGSFFVTLTKELPSPYFDLKEEYPAEFHWGKGHVFLNQRNGSPAGFFDEEPEGEAEAEVEAASPGLDFDPLA